MAFGWDTVAQIGFGLLQDSFSKKGKVSGQEQEFSAVDRALSRSGARRDAIERDAGTPFIPRFQDTLAAEMDAKGNVYKDFHDLIGDTNYARFAEVVKGQVSEPVMTALREDRIDDVIEQRRQVNEGSGELDADDYEDIGDYDYFADEFKNDEEGLKFLHALSDYT